MATAEQQEFLLSLEEEKSEPARRSAATRGRFMRAASSGLSVSVGLAAGQASPTTTTPINFTVTFSKSAGGFVSGDVSTAGSTVGGTLGILVSGGPSVYNVAVSGMTGSGLVQISVPAGSATDPSGAAFPASNAAAVTFVPDITPPSIPTGLTGTPQ